MNNTYLEEIKIKFGFRSMKAKIASVMNIDHTMPFNKRKRNSKKQTDICC